MGPWLLPSWLSTGAIAALCRKAGVAGGLICSLGSAAAAGPIPTPLPEWIFFAQDWCPSEAVLAQIRPHYVITMARCCVYKVSAKDRNSAEAAAAIAPFANRIVPTPDLNQCEHDSPELAAERRQAADAAAAAERQEAATAEADRKAAAAVERKNIRQSLAALDLPALCVAYGRALRDEEWFEVAPAMKGEVLPFAKADIQRRGFLANPTRAARGIVKIGDDVCHLYAAVGEPLYENRTVTKHGAHVQHVYGSSSYFYSDNGRITAWQD